MRKYFGGFLGAGTNRISVVLLDLEYRNVATGLYRINKVVEHFYGERPIEGTHLLKSEVLSCGFDTLGEARDHLIELYKKEVTELQEQIGCIEADIAVLEDEFPTSEIPS